MLTSPATYLRIVFVLLGAGVSLAIAVLDVTLVALAVQGRGWEPAAVALLGAVAVVVPVAGLGLVPGVREIEATAAQTLLRVAVPGGVPGPARTWADRRRTLVWFVLHLLAGAVVVAMVMGSFVAGSVVLGAVVLLAAVATASGLGYALGLVAPGLLGPSYDERIAALESQTVRLVERNRLAREIHDSVGHALASVSVQAGAARRVLDRDPEFVRSALVAIERAAGEAAGDLDHVLGLLRESGDPTRAPAPDLRALDSLVAAARAAGLEVDVVTGGDLAGLPPVLSREAYRIAQEGLTNAMRHATGSRVRLEAVAGDGALVISVTNAAPPARAQRGRGLLGIAERARLLDGEATSEVVEGEFRLRVALPLPVGRGTA